jgi:hypothetical protein
MRDARARLVTCVLTCALPSPRAWCPQMGAMGGPRKYLHDGWNIMDFIVVVTGLLEFILPSLSGLSAMRVCRILRPLSSLHQFPSCMVRATRREGGGSGGGGGYGPRACDVCQCAPPDCWLLAVGCWLLAVGCWLLAVGCWLLAVGFWRHKRRPFVARPRRGDDISERRT